MNELNSRLGQLEARIIDLEEALGLDLWSEAFARMGKRQRLFAAMLAKRRYVRKEALLLALEINDPLAPRDIARRVRRKLAGYGIDVKTDYNIGYYVPESQWPVLRDMFSVRRSNFQKSHPAIRHIDRVDHHA